MHPWQAKASNAIENRFSSPGLVFMGLCFAQRYDPINTADARKEVLFNAGAANRERKSASFEIARCLPGKQLAHQRPLFFQLRKGSINPGAAEFINRQALNDFQFLTVTANRK